MSKKSNTYLARTTGRLKTIRAQIKRLGLTEKTAEDAVRWAGKKGKASSRS